MTVTTRLISLDDAVELGELLRVNRAFLAPWEPVRDDAYFTVEGQRGVIRAALEQHAQATALPHVIVDEGRLVGRVTLSGIARGPFQSCNLGYWISAADNGRGLATAAVGAIVRVAFEQLGLHRIEAGVLPRNIGSQKVLERNGFTRFGVAERYLCIAGEWQDHAMYQLLADGR